jgi:hypothetical protein
MDLTNTHCSYYRVKNTAGQVSHDSLAAAYTASAAEGMQLCTRSQACMIRTNFILLALYHYQIW